MKFTKKILLVDFFRANRSAFACWKSLQAKKIFSAIITSLLKTVKIVLTFKFLLQSPVLSASEQKKPAPIKEWTRLRTSQHWVSPLLSRNFSNPSGSAKKAGSPVRIKVIGRTNWTGKKFHILSTFPGSNRRISHMTFGSTLRFFLGWLFKEGEQNFGSTTRIMAAIKAPVLMHNWFLVLAGVWPMKKDLPKTGGSLNRHNKIMIHDLCSET